eukprot:scaffold79988_cov63-Phaeocystis_antarctica.AAC.6
MTLPTALGSYQGDVQGGAAGILYKGLRSCGRNAATCEQRGKRVATALVATTSVLYQTMGICLYRRAQPPHARDSWHEPPSAAKGAVEPQRLGTSCTSAKTG